MFPVARRGLFALARRAHQARVSRALPRALGGRVDRLPKRGHRQDAESPAADEVGEGRAGQSGTSADREVDVVTDVEAENARLAAASDVAGAGTAAGRAPRRSGWWRALLSAVCIVLAGVLLPVSIVAAWSRAQLVDESQFVATLAPLAHDPQVQGLVIDQTTGAIDEKVNYDQITGNVIDGIAGLGLP